MILPEHIQSVSCRLSSLQWVPWETRNLERPAFAVRESFWQFPELRSLECDLGVLKKEFVEFFIQARVRLERSVEASLILGRFGFYYVETLLKFFILLPNHRELQRFEENPSSYLPKRYFGQRVSFRVEASLGEGEREAVTELLGSAFSQDRFHRDPRCDKRLADQRFRNWLSDITQRTDWWICIGEVEGRPCGVNVFDKDVMILTAMDKQYQGKGFGHCLFLGSLVKAKERGYKRVWGAISAHNVAALRTLLRVGPLGYGNVDVTFHYWYPENVRKGDGDAG
jgi:RimJ/RimL family protein N-acetyltransferase